jgi:hypothetical protein
MRLNKSSDLKSKAANRDIDVAGKNLADSGPQQNPGVVSNGEDLIQCLAPGKDLRARHTRSKSRALLVGPGHDLDRAKRSLCPGYHRLDGFQCGQDTENAIESSARRLRVDMRAGKHRRERRIATLIAKEKIRDAIGKGNKADLAGP